MDQAEASTVCQEMIRSVIRRLRSPDMRIIPLLSQLEPEPQEVWPRNGHFGPVLRTTSTNRTWMRSSPSPEGPSGFFNLGPAGRR
jgi:hypothetical protein